MPIRRPAFSAVSTASAEDSVPATTSSRSIKTTGLKKCMPTTRSGRSAAVASAVTGREDVFVASTVSGPQTRERPANSSRLISRLSGAASITRSHPARPSSVGHAQEQVACGGRLLGRPPAALPALLEACLDRGDPTVERLRERVVQTRLEAGEAADLGDARAHRSGAAHADDLYVFQSGTSGGVSPSQ